jgi:hypothetical protein
MSLIISEAEWQESKRRTDDWVKTLALPNGWMEIHIPIDAHPELEGQRAFQHINGRRVVVSVGFHDGWWLHVSVSREKRIPSYEDLADVKRVFVTDAVQAVQIFPRRERHVNIHPNCLHLWARLDGSDGLPDFGREGTI